MYAFISVLQLFITYEQLLSQLLEMVNDLKHRSNQGHVLCRLQTIFKENFLLKKRFSI